MGVFFAIFALMMLDRPVPQGAAIWLFVVGIWYMVEHGRMKEGGISSSKERFTPAPVG